MFPRSCGAVCILYGLGAYDAPQAKKGMEYVMKIALGNKGAWTSQGFPFYSTYYLAQAAFMAGKEYWEKLWPPLRDFLLTSQQPDGGWSGEGGPEYGTAIALIVLQIPYRYLPIYQEGISEGAPLAEKQVEGAGQP